MTRIKKDKQGLYAQIGGWICRPVANIYSVRGKNEPELIPSTRFNEGDEVRGSHPAGHLAYLRTGKRGTPDYYMEAWDVIDLVPEFKRKEEEAKAKGDLPIDTSAMKVDMAKLKKDLGLE